ncbi:DUF485 domain-containing protein [Cupriavidus plantarum]|uniref:DUF485 domain-containing protein n=1 Tax=Cupriavidus plantarum TaxID=942865 RepID=UPI000EAED764|nr:DUF485 domain-containing protein [Cupriavidus plantarum]RLK45708.1 uncharacterized protein DUF485 [Cupriavidus plantarum]CAG2127940.1 hypothetical protein LMG26296_00986 [Cupriavidus plantarum]SMR66882.1 Protein of unknown function, DUF485 [Cupriavidus plantarum]
MNRIPTQEGENVALGMALTVLQVLTYMSFVAACCFAPAFIKGQTLTHGIPMSFAMGLGVIALGVILTIVYVAVTNRAEGAK